MPLLQQYHVTNSALGDQHVSGMDLCQVHVPPVSLTCHYHMPETTAPTTPPLFHGQ